MKILLTGGGTLGSVTPLLAIVERIREQKPNAEFLWFGTKKGPERKIIEEYNIPFKPIFNGKLRRYFSWRNFIDPFFIELGFWQSLWLVGRSKPDIILSAGSFVSVPVVWAGWFLRVPSLIHQLDIIPSLSNQLMEPVAKRITVTFEKSLEDFSSKKTVWVGNPIRKLKAKSEKRKAKEFFKLEDDFPTILIMGGGTGALALNELVIKSLPELIKFCQIIHLTGTKKLQPKKLQPNRYHSYESLTKEMPLVLEAADLIICRAGMGSLTELSVLKKPAIIIPLPNTHQEANANYFGRQDAAIVLSQKDLTAERLVEQTRGLLSDKNRLKELRENISNIIKENAAENILKEINKLINV